MIYIYIYNIYNIHPSTISCLLVRHHRKTKMETLETHKITDLLYTFPTPPKKSTFRWGEFQCPVFCFFSLRCLCFYLRDLTQAAGHRYLPQPATLQSSKAKFHPQLWQCFIDQTWPDKVGPDGQTFCSNCSSRKLEKSYKKSNS